MMQGNAKILSMAGATWVPAVPDATMFHPVNDWKKEENSRKREIAMEQARFIHDKIHGKSTQRVVTHSTTVNLNLKLTDIAK